MVLLIVGFAASVHVARYLQLLEGTGWDIHLFDSRLATRAHPELPAVTLHEAGPLPDFGARADALSELIDRLAPDVIHSHELQHGGALVDVVRRRRGSLPAPWLVTNWGTDIFWHGRDPTHAPRIRSIVQACDYYCAECHRDVALARAFGLRGRVIGVWPVAGGIDADRAEALKAPGPTSTRRSIAVKGVAGPVGLGHVAAAAVERCGELLTGWEICAYQAHDEVGDRLRAIAAAHGADYNELSDESAQRSSHDELLEMHGRSRTSLGLNRSDALSTSFLEALTMGSFPVQSSTSCGTEIAPQGRGALFVAPTDVEAVAAALRRALTDDALVDAAAPRNAVAAREHLDRAHTGARVIDAYERIVFDRALQAA